MPSLADVVPSLAAGLGLRGFANTLDCPDVQHAVVCLIDGLGAELLDAHPDWAPNLGRGERSTIESVFPTTTPAALGTLGTGLLPGAHGLVGASFLLPETGAILSPLSWGDTPSPIAVQPEPTLFEVIAREGVEVRTVSAAKFERSGLTRSVLRGGDYRGAEDLAARVREVAIATSGAARSLTYVYWPDLDRVGHEHGAGSRQWLRALAEVDRLVQQLADALPANAAMVVTSDHGMVNCPPEGRVQIEAWPELRADVAQIAGEPRARHLYVREGTGADVARRWREALGDRARVFTRGELVDSGLLGEVEEYAAERIGDVVAVAMGQTSLVSEVDPRVSALIGQHGALTAAEWAVPAIWFVGDR